VPPHSSGLSHLATPFFSLMAELHGEFYSRS